MPFVSEAQRRFMFAKHPKIAREFAAATPKGANLPEHVRHMAHGGTVERSNYSKEFVHGLRKMMRSRKRKTT